MSDTTEPSRRSGDSRRRRSRGGRNRSNRNDNRRSGDRDRDSRDGRSSGPQRSEEFRPQSSRSSRSRKPAPAPLSLWQKILKAVGLYKEPAPPTRSGRKSDSTRPPREPREPRAPKSNTRNARTSEGSSGDSPAQERPERRPSKRGERGARKSERPRGGDGSTVESPRVYVGNLSYEATEEDLKELFKGVGGVRNVEVVYNRSTHRSKGYAFVEMLHMDEAVRAVEVLNDQPFMGRKMMVSGAKSKGQDDRDEKEERQDRESKPVVVAPLPTFDESAAEEVTAAEAEPEIQTIVETVTEEAAPAEEIPVAAAPEVVEAPATEAPAEEEESKMA